MYSIEDILLQKAAEDEQFRAGAGELGLAAGAVLGTAAGLGMGVGGREKVMPDDPIGMKARITAGNVGRRFAGAGALALMTGALGKEVAKATIGDSPGAALLAKLQVQGSLNTAEKYQLEKLVKEAYNSQIGIG